jgi:hypothetical protein
LIIRTAEQIAAEAEADARSQAVAAARKLLAETDWYVTRHMETGKEIPKDIAKTRSDARKMISG